jgi:signal transduction histidine kinase
VGTAFLRLRPVLVGPLMVLMLAALSASGAPRRQMLAVGSVAATMFALFGFEAWRGRRRVFDERELFRSLVATLVGIACVCGATGGITSPAVPMFLAPTAVGFAAFGRRAYGAAILAALAALVVLLLVVRAPFPEVAEAPRRIMFAGAILDAALLLRVGVAGLTDAHARAAEALAAAGDEIAAAARGRTHALEALGAKVAHEVKNPLAAIRALVEVMIEGADERGRRRLSVAASEVARIEAILAGYLSFARPFADVRPARTEIDALLQGVATMLEARAARLDVTIEIDGPACAWRADADRLKEALLNLGLNAVEATPRGGRVALAWREERDDLVITVADTGAGMDAETLAKLGTPFFTRRPGGTGLGVALARQVAEQHGGRLDFESTEGAGTTATLRLPRGANDADHPDL